MVEVNYGNDDAQFAPAFEQQPQQGHRINASGNGDAGAVPGLQQIILPNNRHYLLRQRMHGNMVQLRGDLTYYSKREW